MKKELTPEQKVSIILNCEELISAVTMLILLMEDAEINNFINAKYEIGEFEYELSFTKKHLAKNDNP